jgi:Zn-finger nucleic acid-binding protein
MAMAYLCPRDRTKLKWVHFGFKGHWYCPSCNGALVFERHLRKHPASLTFFENLDRQVMETSEINCPECLGKFEGIRIAGRTRVFAIDRCRTCQLFWFDPQELSMLLDSGAKPVDLSDGSSLIGHSYQRDNSDLAETLRTIFAERNHQNRRRSFVWTRAFKFALIAISVALMSLTAGIDHEYRAVRVYRGGSPLGFATMALLSSLLFVWRNYPIAAFLALLWNFSCLMVWLARF